MNIDDNVKTVGKIRTKYQRGINDLYIWSSVAIDALTQTLEEGHVFDSQYVSVPSKRKTKTVKRTHEQVAKIIRGAKDKELLASVFTYLVAQMEAFVSDLLIHMLEANPSKIKTRVNDVDHLKKVDVHEIIDRKSKKDLVRSIIDREMLSLFYAKPVAQLEYMEKVCDVELEYDLKSSFVEMKATRDLLVHNSGMINVLYLAKARNAARGELGDRIVVDIDYLKSSMASAKSLIGKTCSGIQRNLKNA